MMSILLPVLTFTQYCYPYLIHVGLDGIKSYHANLKSPADNLCKQFDPRSGLRKNVGPDLDPNRLTL